MDALIHNFCGYCGQPRSRLGTDTHNCPTPHPETESRKSSGGQDLLRPGSSRGGVRFCRYCGKQLSDRSALWKHEGGKNRDIAGSAVCQRQHAELAGVSAAVPNDTSPALQRTQPPRPPPYRGSAMLAHSNVPSTHLFESSQASGYRTTTPLRPSHQHMVSPVPLGSPHPTFSSQMQYQPGMQSHAVTGSSDSSYSVMGDWSRSFDRAVSYAAGDAYYHSAGHVWSNVDHTHSATNTSTYNANFY